MASFGIMIIIIAWIHTQNYYNFELEIYRFGCDAYGVPNRPWISKSEWIYWAFARKERQVEKITRFHKIHHQ